MTRRIIHDGTRQYLDGRVVLYGHVEEDLKKRKNGRQKGSVAEREVARLVQDWWRPFEPEATFVRTPLSGGWGGPTVRREFQAAGDLMAANAPRWPFGVEVKRREGWNLQRVMDGRSSPVWGWWRQCQKAAAEMSKIPQLWFRKSRMDWLVMMPEQINDWLPEPAERSVPVVMWWRDQLAKTVDFGAVMPAIWRASQVLASDPANYGRFWSPRLRRAVLKGIRPSVPMRAASTRSSSD